MGGETAFDLQQQYSTAAWYEQPQVYEPLRKRLKTIPADAPEQIAALQAEIAELKGMTAYARTSEAAKQSVEYWCERATLAEEVGKIVKADLAAAREQLEGMYAAIQDILNQHKPTQKGEQNAAQAADDHVRPPDEKAVG